MRWVYESTTVRPRRSNARLRRTSCPGPVPSFDRASGGGTAGSGSEQAIFHGALAGLAGVVSGELEQTLVTDLGLPVDYIAIRPVGFLIRRPAPFQVGFDLFWQSGGP